MHDLEKRIINFMQHIGIWYIIIVFFPLESCLENTNLSLSKSAIVEPRYNIKSSAKEKPSAELTPPATLTEIDKSEFEDSQKFPTNTSSNKEYASFWTEEESKEDALEREIVVKNKNDKPTANQTNGNIIRADRFQINQNIVKEQKASKLVREKKLQQRVFTVREKGYSVRFYKKDNLWRAKVADITGKKFNLPAHLSERDINLLTSTISSRTGLIQLVLPTGTKEGYVYLGGLQGGEKNKNNSDMDQDSDNDEEDNGDQDLDDDKSNKPSKEDQQEKNSNTGTKRKRSSSSEEDSSSNNELSNTKKTINKKDQKSEGKSTSKNSKDEADNQNKDQQKESDVNEAYQYEDIDIQAILESRIREIFGEERAFNDKQIHVMAAADNITRNSLTEILRMDKDNNSFTDRILLIPCNLGNAHWVGLMLEIDKNENLIQAEYMDSLGKDSQIQTNYKRQLKSLYPNAKPETVSILEQDDYTSCGAYTIENFIRALLQERTLNKKNPINTSLKINYTKEKAGVAEGSSSTTIRKDNKDDINLNDFNKDNKINNKKIRRQHLDILRKYDPNFYNGFYIRQKNNRPTTASISEQLGYIKRLQNVTFSLKEVKVMAEVKYNLMNIKNEKIRKELWEVFATSAKTNHNHGLYLNSIRQKLTESVNNIKSIQNNKSDQETLESIIKILFNIDWKFTDTLFLDKEDFCLTYEALKSVTNISVRKEKLGRFLTEIDEEIEDKDIQTVLWQQASFNKKNDYRVLYNNQEKGEHLKEVQDAEKEYTKAIDSMKRYNMNFLGDIDDMDTSADINLLQESIDNFISAASKGHKKAKEQLRKLQEEGNYNNTDEDIQNLIKDAVKAAADPSDLTDFFKITENDLKHLHLQDLIVMELDPKKAPADIEWGGVLIDIKEDNNILPRDPADDSKDLTYKVSISNIENFDMIQVPKQGPEKFIFGPLFKSGEKRYDDLVLAIDTSGEGEDETTYCVAKRSGEFYFVVEVGGITGKHLPGKNSKEIYQLTLEKLATVAKDHHVNTIYLEVNNDRSYEFTLNQILKEKGLDHIFIHAYLNRENKQERIINGLSPLLKQHKLIINKEVLRQDCNSIPTTDLDYKLFYQFMTIQKYQIGSNTYFDGGNPKHDDRIDVVNSAITYLKNRKEPKARVYTQKELRDKGIKIEKTFATTELKKLQEKFNEYSSLELKETKFDLAVNYMEGSQGIVQNYKEAKKLLEEILSIVPNDAACLERLGKIYKYGLGTPEDPLQAYVCYKEALRNNENPETLFELYDILRKNLKEKFVKKVYDKSIKFLKKSADLEYLPAEYKLSKIILSKEKEKGAYREAKSLLYKAQRRGYQKANYFKAKLVFNELGFKKDIIKYLEQASIVDMKAIPPRFGLAKAQLALANIYYYKQKDYQKSLDYYSKAAVFYTEAKEQLAFIYYHGRGTKKNLNKALALFLELFIEKQDKYMFYQNDFNLKSNRDNFYNEIVQEEIVKEIKQRSKDEIIRIMLEICRMNQEIGINLPKGLTEEKMLKLKNS